MKTGLSTKVRCGSNEQREQDERGEEEGGDLRDGVLHDRDGEIRLALRSERDADDVLDRVPGDRDDHEARERLRDAERLDGRVEGVDEPVGHERRRDAAHGEHDDRGPERQRRRACSACASSRGSSEWR